MSDVRLIEAPLEIAFSLQSSNEIDFEREYIQLSEVENDAIGQWLRNARGKGDSSDDAVVIQLLVELYRKIDHLEQVVLQSAPKRIPLTFEGKISRIGYEHFELLEPQLEIAQHYYGRLDMPVHPQREVSFYFEAITPTLAKIIRIHQKDTSDWASHMMARERAMIRHLKGYE